MTTRSSSARRMTHRVSLSFILFSLESRQIVHNQLRAILLPEHLAVDKRDAADDEGTVQKAGLKNS